MRKFFLGLALTVCVRTAWSDCLDTTVVLKNGTAGFNSSTGVYDPDAGGALNSVFTGCSDAAITVRLNLDATVANAIKDTVKLSNSIKINGRVGKTTLLTMTRSSSPPANVLDTLFTLVENNSGAPNLLTVGSGNPVTLRDMGFARKAINNNTHSVSIGGKYTQVTGCHFWMLDNSSQGTGALLDITTDTVLVERSLVRAPPDGDGRSSAIHTGGSATRVEIRANVFFSTGLQMAATGTFHAFANTFVGSRNGYSAITVGTGIAAADNAVIMHNLFAAKADTLPPIAFSGAGFSVSDSILKNAWSRGKANLALAAYNNGTVTMTLNGASGNNTNTALPRGFSNYGPSSYEVKDYPLTELRSDPLLARKNSDFGKIFRVFVNSNWTGISDIKDLAASRLYFTNFAPFLAGKTWLTNVKVGAFVDQDSYETPSPLDSGAQGASLKFQRDTTTTTRIKMTQTRYDANYYKTSSLTPEFMYFFFSNTLS
jgi:hypothetical protein